MSSAQGLVGREAELALAAAAVRQLSEGRASALVIEGEAGIGKTAWCRASPIMRVRVTWPCSAARLIHLSAPVRSAWSPRRWV
ncbi:MAG TPA: AAA family ATPase [Streptosporangiaceae bacterium]|nr:AAA family ATPase [Streptosporangiaceae bacterium]